MTNAIESGPGGKAPATHAGHARASRLSRWSALRRANGQEGRRHTPPRREETAGHYVIASVPRTSLDRTAGEAIDGLLAHAYDCVDICCVLDADDRLVGVLPLAGLLALPRDMPLGHAVHAGFPKVHADTDQEKVASLALHHALSAVPVIDGNGRLLGVVPPAALLHILRREHVEDIHRFAGITRENLRAREAIEAPPMRRLRHRLPGLLERLGTDPAYGSGPLATIIQDLLSLLTYFVTIGAMMPGPA